MRAAHRMQAHERRHERLDHEFRGLGGGEGAAARGEELCKVPALARRREDVDVRVVLRAARLGSHERCRPVCKRSVELARSGALRSRL